MLGFPYLREILLARIRERAHMSFTPYLSHSWCLIPLTQENEIPWKEVECPQNTQGSSSWRSYLKIGCLWTTNDALCSYPNRNEEI